MIDDETLLLLNAYVDGELSPVEALAMQRRISAEPDLRTLYDQMRGLSGKLKAVLPGEAVPDERLRGRILGEIGFREQAAPIASAGRTLPGLAMAASLVIGVVLGHFAAGYNAPVSPDGAGLSETMLGAHLRGLAAQQPFDIASSDRHVVRPWFNGRTTISPKAPDLSADGFPLVGGRIDVVAEKTVPTLVYNRRRHVISVTAVPGDAGIAPFEETRGGSNILRWDAGSLSYIAVSDLNMAELRGFAERFRAAP